MYYVGLDVHARSISVCILDEVGKVVKKMTYQGWWGGFPKWLRRRIEGRFAAVFEATCGYGWFFDQLTALGARVSVAHPGHLRLIFHCKRKTDRIDAEKLAKLLYLDMVPPVHVPSIHTRQWRELIEYRHRVVSRRTRAKNSLRTLLRTYAIEGPKGLWTKRGRAWLKDLALPGLTVELRRDQFVEDLERLTGQIGRAEAVLDGIADRHPGVGLLRTIPGVGVRTAEAVVAYIDRPARFRRNQCVGAYFGLVPCEDSSAGKRRLGHITKDGPATVRKLLCEAAWQVVRRDAGMRAYFERICRGKKDRRKIAITATAHRLVRAMHAMLLTGEVWRGAA